jgi:hypothetical protein
MHHKMLALVAGAAISVLMLAPDTALARGGFGSGHFAGFHGARLGHFGGAHFGGFGGHFARFHRDRDDGRFAGFHGARLGHFGDAHFGGFGGGRGNAVVRPAPVPRPWP